MQIIDGAFMGWSTEIHTILKREHIGLIATVPDAGLTEVLTLCEDDPQISVVTLSTEQEGMGLVFGAWLGGRRGAVFMQSSGTGNCVNALTLAAATRTPVVMLVTMRGQWGEFNPWQVAMGQATQTVFEAIGVTCFDVQDPGQIAETFSAASALAFNSAIPTAVLIHQRAIGTKEF